METKLERKRRSKREWYARNKQSAIDAVERLRNERRAWLAEYKSTLSCKQCGFSHPAALDFHHRNPSDKSLGVSDMASKGFSIDNMLAEITKCDVLCANCHRIHHYQEIAQSG